MTVEIIKNSFNAGEWSPLLDPRTDLEKSRSACRTLKNAIVHPQGAAEMRPGTYYKGSPKYHDKESRLIPFIYSSETAYHLEFGANYIRFWEMGGTQIMLNGLPYEIYSPYAEADIWRINGRTHSFDVIYLFHPNYHPKKLQRYSETDWRLADLDCKDGPFLPENTDTSLMITPSAVSGTITLTASTIKGDNVHGTWGGTVTGSWAPFGSYKYSGFKFTAPTGCSGFRKVRTYFQAAHATTINTIKCYLYSNSGSSPGTRLSIATNIASVGGDEGAGTRYWYFNDYPIVAGTAYWVVFECNATSTAIKQQYVAHSTSYGTGSASAITNITDSATTESYVEIIYTKSGSASLFNENHVGSLWRIRHGGKKESKVIAGDDSWTTELEIYGKFSVMVTSFSGNPYQGRLVLQKSFDSGAIWHDVAEFNLSTKQEFFESKMGVIYRLGCATGDRIVGKASVLLAQSDIWGVCRVTEYTSASVVTATVYSAMGGTTATPVWREGSWSAYRGFPQAACFHEDRLYCGGTTYQPTQLWGSWVGEYEKHMPGDTADAALDLLLSSLDNPIQWVSSYTGFLVGTLGEEAWLKQPQDKPLTNENLPKVIVQGSTGSAIALQPDKAGPSMVFCQMHRRKILEILYAYGEDRFKPSDLSRSAPHITARGVKDLAYAKEPVPLLLAVMDDGTIGALTYYRDEEVIGWSLWDTEGWFESVSVGPSNISEAAGYSEIWFVVKRTINGTIRRFIEVLANHDTVTDAEDFHCVDCGIVYDGSSVTTIPGLDHLNNEVVKVLADGVDVSPETVGVADNVSDMDVFEDNCSDITIWTDFDYNGESTQGTGKYHFAVATPGFANHAERYIFTCQESESSDPARVTIQFTLKTANLPVYATSEYFRIEYDLAEKHLHALISSDGIRVWKGASLTLVYNATIANGSDIKWMFDWDTVAETLSIYKNGVKVVTDSASCAVSGWSPRGKFFLGLYSTTTSGMTADVSAIKVGTSVVAKDGTIRLGTAAGVVHAGLSYDFIAETLRLDSGPGPGTIQGKIKTIKRVEPRFRNTIGGLTAPMVGPSDDECTNLIAIPSDASGDEPVDVPVDWKFSSDLRGRVAIKQSSPCPMTLLSIITSLDVEDA